MKSLSCCVVIPVYKISPDETELFSIQNTVKKMAGCPFFFVAPKKLDMSAYSQFAGVRTVRFSNWYFKNIYGYNRLMLSAGFYKKFLDYEYMLVVQPDALIFRDSAYLAELLEKNSFDYWGAPWKKKFVARNFSFYKYRKWLKIFTPIFHFFETQECVCEVGNGGLSLRNVSKTIALLKKNVFLKTLWGSAEDDFFSYFGQMNKVGFSIAPASLASKLSWEEYFHDNLHYEDLPFGMHDWKRYFPDAMSLWNALQEDPDLFHEPSTYKLGNVVYFCADGFNATPYMLSGFYNSEKNGSWTVADRAELLFRFEDSVVGKEKSFYGEILFSKAWNDCRAVNIFINNKFLTQKNCSSGKIEFEFQCDSSFVLLGLDMCFAYRPTSLDISSERRNLGIYIKSLRFTPLDTYIYGAGKVARLVLRRMRSVCVEPIKCLVQDTSQNSDSLLGVPIVSLDDVEANGACVVVAVGKKFQDEVCEALRAKGFSNVELYTEYFNGR